MIIILKPSGWLTGTELNEKTNHVDFIFEGINTASQDLYFSIYYKIVKNQITATSLINAAEWLGWPHTYNRHFHFNLSTGFNAGLENTRIDNQGNAYQASPSEKYQDKTAALKRLENFALSKNIKIFDVDLNYSFTNATASFQEKFFAIFEKKKPAFLHPLFLLLSWFRSLLKRG